jgi:hypothetical protein
MAITHLSTKGREESSCLAPALLVRAHLGPYSCREKRVSESISSRQKEGKLSGSTRGGGLSSPLRSAQDATTGERVHLRLSRSAGWSVFFPAWARSCSSPAQSLEPLLMTMLMTLS